MDGQPATKGGDHTLRVLRRLILHYRLDRRYIEFQKLFAQHRSQIIELLGVLVAISKHLQDQHIAARLDHCPTLQPLRKHIFYEESLRARGQALLQARRPQLDALIAHLEALANGHDDKRVEVAGNMAGAWFAAPETGDPHTLIATGLLLLAGPVDRDTLADAVQTSYFDLKNSIPPDSAGSA